MGIVDEEATTIADELPATTPTALPEPRAAKPGDGWVRGGGSGMWMRVACLPLLVQKVLVRAIGSKMDDCTID
jgi:hypothetical protein